MRLQEEMKKLEYLQKQREQQSELVRALQQRDQYGAQGGAASSSGATGSSANQGESWNRMLYSMLQQNKME